MFKSTMLLFLFGLLSLLTACSPQTQKDQIADAQFCLDKAQDASTANACVAKIASIQSPEANALRCAAGFIGSGVTKPENLSKALNAIKDSNNGGSSATTMMSFLNLGSDADATKIFNYCAASDNKGMALIAAMARSATTLINIVGPSFDPATGAAQLETVINNIAVAYANDPTDSSIQDTLSSIGDSVGTVYEMTCGGSNQGNSDICKSI
ncbi:MAG TPA: hypothetical protein VN132_13395, partial [Bdellovibrio sp.]|nr:hypothetical protein [Bdellovibrio sp.]